MTDNHQLLLTLDRRTRAMQDEGHYIARRLDHAIHLLDRLLRHHERASFGFFLATDRDDPTMPSITATDITTAQVLKFGLIGATPAGATFAEPTVVVTTGTGTVALQPSVQGNAGAFTTAGVFTPGAGFTGPVVISAEVQGVDDQDASFNVVAVPAPETVSFDPTLFVAQAA